MRLLVMLILFLYVGPFEANAQLFGGQIKRGKGTVTALSCGSVVNSGNLYAASMANLFPIQVEMEVLLVVKWLPQPV